MLPRHVRVGIFLLLLLGCADQPEPEAATKDETPAANVYTAASAAPQTREEKAIEVGRKLLQVRPGMTRQQVEELLGPPDREDWRQNTDRLDKQPDGFKFVACPYVIYYCSPPNQPPGPHLMTVVYRSEPLKPIPMQEHRDEPLKPISMDAQVIDVRGPHLPY